MSSDVLEQRDCETAESCIETDGTRTIWEVSVVNNTGWSVVLSGTVDGTDQRAREQAILELNHAIDELVEHLWEVKH